MHYLKTVVFDWQRNKVFTHHHFGDLDPFNRFSLENECSRDRELVVAFAFGKLIMREAP